MKTGIIRPGNLALAALSLVLTIFSALSLVAQEHQSGLRNIEPVNAERVKEIAALLPDEPRGFGDPIDVRPRWDSMYATGNFNRWIADADSISALPFPQLTEEIYMSYFGGRDSETSKRFILKRRMLLTRMVWAECLTNKGKYLPAIIAALSDIANTRSWTFPAEDRKKTNYEGRIYTIGLSSAAYGSDIAQSLYLLQTKLPVALREQLRKALEQRVFTPTLNAIRYKNANEEFVSLLDNGNHNSVTLAYLAIAALAVIKDKEERATFATIAERYSANFVMGYMDDGFCTEGIGYYSYGFNHYVFLREILWQSTMGKLDLFNSPKAKRMAMFAPSMEIINGIYPAISDCEQYAKPGPHLMYYLNKNFSLGLETYRELPAYLEQPALCYLVYYFPNAASYVAHTTRKKSASLRNYYKQAGVLTVRPERGSALEMGATFKGGNNAEHHNHNDLGSYTIVVGNELLTGDAGLATYTPKYFGKERYVLFKTTSSYGHNVPLVSGTQQRAGKEAQATVTETSFTDQKDVFVVDIGAAYPVPDLKKLSRTFTYDRSAHGYITVEDKFAFNGRRDFETALITRHKWKKLTDSTIEIIGLKEKVRVLITTSESAFSISDEIIDEGPEPYTRIAVRLNRPVSGGFVRMTFERD